MYRVNATILLWMIWFIPFLTDFSIALLHLIPIRTTWYTAEYPIIDLFLLYQNLTDHPHPLPWSREIDHPDLTWSLRRRTWKFRKPPGTKTTPIGTNGWVGDFFISSAELDSTSISTQPLTMMRIRTRSSAVILILLRFLRFPVTILSNEPPTH